MAKKEISEAQKKELLKVLKMRFEKKHESS